MIQCTITYYMSSRQSTPHLSKTDLLNLIPERKALCYQLPATPLTLILQKKHPSSENNPTHNHDKLSKARFSLLGILTSLHPQPLDRRLIAALLQAVGDERLLQDGGRQPRLLILELRPGLGLENLGAVLVDEAHGARFQLLGPVHVRDAQPVTHVRDCELLQYTLEAEASIRAGEEYYNIHLL